MIRVNNFVFYFWSANVRVMCVVNVNVKMSMDGYCFGWTFAFKVHWMYWNTNVCIHAYATRTRTRTRVHSHIQNVSLKNATYLLLKFSKILSMFSYITHMNGMDWKVSKTTTIRAKASPNGVPCNEVSIKSENWTELVKWIAVHIPFVNTEMQWCNFGFCF